MRDIAAIAILLTASSALAQTTPTAPAPDSAQVSPVPALQADTSAWSFSASAYTYFVPDDRDYVQPTFVADRGSLHLEVRYNYEDLETGSAWIGWNLSAGHEVALEFTPMIAAVVGNTAGFAAGYKGSLLWKRLELDSESEYVFDSGGVSDYFLYTWSQLTVAPVERFSFGVVVQRTRAYESEREIQRGLLAGYSQQSTSVSAVVFNPDDDRPTFVLVLDVAF